MVQVIGLDGFSVEIAGDNFETLVFAPDESGVVKEVTRHLPASAMACARRRAHLVRMPGSRRPRRGGPASSTRGVARGHRQAARPGASRAVAARCPAAVRKLRGNGRSRRGPRDSPVEVGRGLQDGARRTVRGRGARPNGGSSTPCPHGGEERDGRDRGGAAAGAARPCPARASRWRKSTELSGGGDGAGDARRRDHRCLHCQPVYVCSGSRGLPG